MNWIKNEGANLEEKERQQRQLQEEQKKFRNFYDALLEEKLGLAETRDDSIEALRQQVKEQAARIAALQAKYEPEEGVPLQQ